MTYPWRFITVSFLAGVAVGAVSPMLTRPRGDGHNPEKHRAHIMAHMNSELKLNDQQRSQIDAILKVSMEQREAVFAETDKKVEVLMLQSRAQTRQLLDPDQQQRFDAMMARFDARRKKNGLPPHP